MTVRNTPNVAASQITLTSAQQAAASMQTYTSPTPGKSPCANCGKRPGTIWWGDALAQTHGFMQLWCAICALEAQIKHAKERARKLPGMERKLARLKAREARRMKR